MKLFYVINEPMLNYQVGYRQAVKQRIEEGDLTDCFFYSFYVKLAAFNMQSTLVLNDIICEVCSFRPDAILFAHPGYFHFDSNFFRELEQALGYKPTYALDERDVYGRYVKRLPAQTLSLSTKCDVTFLVCSGGWMYKQFQKHRKGRLIYLPHVCDDIHFGKGNSGNRQKLYDVVMIGNLVKSRIPFNSMPGVKERIKVAEAMYKRHRKRFAVFGSGWEKYPFAAGPVPFFEQEKVLHSSHLSIGVDHFLDYDQYYSDRLPIALFSGVPHLSWETPKLNQLFKDREHIYYYKSVHESTVKSDAILSGKFEEATLIARQAKGLVETNYTEAWRMKRLIDTINDIRGRKYND